MKRIPTTPFVLLILALCAGGVSAQQVGTIRGLVTDRDFGGPLGGVQVLIVETGQKVESGDEGNYALTQVAAGRYTLVFSKSGSVSEPRSGVIVSSGSLTELNVSLAGEFVDMEEVVVQNELQLNAGSEAALLDIRFNSPALLDAVGADLMSRAGAGDAASALRLVSGATVQDGKSAVIRGLPDRYVSSQMNNVRLPSADDKKRAVELDQFPAAVIESILVSKTFTPDQQGDASGGAVNLRLKGIPNEPLFFQFKSQIGYNSQVKDRNDFLSYDGGGLDFWGEDDGGRDMQLDRLGMDWLGAVGSSEDEAPIDYKWSVAGGGSIELDDGLKIGGFGSFFYERSADFSNDGKDDNLWVTTPGAQLEPQSFQGTPSDGDFKTGLFDVTKASQEVQWGVLATVGVEWEEQKISLTYLHTRTTQDKVTLAEDTRGKQYYFPGYDPNDPSTPGHDSPDSAPYVRLETLEYTERTTSTLQLNGHHVVPVDDFGFEGAWMFKAPEIDWTIAYSSADSYQPDKRQFGEVWYPEFAPIPQFVIPATHRPFKPAANFTLGNLQRIWKTTEEESDQYQVNLKLPFEQWNGQVGSLRFGYFDDEVKRTYDQESFSNFNNSGIEFAAPFETDWSSVFGSEGGHPITESNFDVDYDGEQKITAWYAMLELPIFDNLKVIGGVRFESTEIGIVNDPEPQATWFPPGSVAPTALNPGEADVLFEQDDVLPSISLEFKPVEGVTLRAAYNETVARQTFRELSPILQQEFLGGPIFIGNPDLQMSAVTNYDLRADWVPYQGGLVSVSWFHKDIKDAIEYVQRIVAFNYTTAVNYPEGEIDGWEFEIRHDLGRLWSGFDGVSLGANLTLIDSQVQLPDDEIADFAALGVDLRSRDMTNAPRYLYNIYLTYDQPDWGTQVGLFYTVQGDSLTAGAGESNGNLVPNIYLKGYGTLNLSVSQKLGEGLKLQFQAKNLLNPDIKTVYRGDGLDERTETSISKGIDFSLSLSGEIRF